MQEEQTSRVTNELEVPPNYRLIRAMCVFFLFIVAASQVHELYVLYNMGKAFSTHTFSYLQAVFILVLLVPCVWILIYQSYKTVSLVEIAGTALYFPEHDALFTLDKSYYYSFERTAPNRIMLPSVKLFNDVEAVYICNACPESAQILSKIKIQSNEIQSKFSLLEFKIILFFLLIALTTVSIGVISPNFLGLFL